MRKSTITVMSFKELSPEVQKRVLSKHRYWNVTGIAWWLDIYKNWEAKLHKLGFENAGITFSGFWSKGAGACFNADLNIDVISTFFMYCKYPQEYHRIRNLRAIATAVNNGKVTYTLESHPTNLCNENTKFINCESSLQHDKIGVFDFVESIEATRNQLCREIYEDLKDTVFYLVSDKAVESALVTNKCEFTADGSDWYEG